MSYFSERPRAAITALVLLFASVEFFFRSSILLGTVALYQRDLLLLYFPLVQSALRGLSEGALPLRDPSSAFGQPLLADPSCQILYPPVALHFFLPPHLAYAWFVSIHSVFGALGVALVARRFSGGSWLAALVGGLAWLVSGPLQSLATLWHHQAGAAWIPWVVLCLARVAAKEGGAALALGAVFGGQILAGSADMCAMTILLSVLFIAPRDYLRCWRDWLTSAGTALALSAGVWLPAAQLVLNSARSALPEATRTYWSLHPLTAIEFFLPIPLTALPFLSEWRTAIFEGREPFLGSMFLGTAIFPLCLAALADAAVSRTVRLASFLGISGGFLIALGKHASAYAWVVAIIPPLRILRFPSKAMVPTAVLICVLAGVGAVAIRRSSRARMNAFAGILILGGAALALTGPLLGGFASVFLDGRDTLLMAAFWRSLPLHLLDSVGLLVLLAGWVRWPSGRPGIFFATLLLLGHLRQSYYVHANFNGIVPTAILSYKPEHLAALRPPGDGRLYVYDYQLFLGRAMKYLGRDGDAGPVGLEGLGPDAASVVSSRAYVTPLVGAFWGIDYAWDADLRLLFDRRLASLTVGLRRVEGTPGFVKLLQISGVSRVAALHEPGMEDLRLLTRRKIFHPEDLRVFEVPEPLPRAFLTTGRTRSTGSDLADLLGRGFDPTTTVLVEAGPIRPAVPGFAGTTRILDRRADRLTVETSANDPAFLTVLEGIMPGWRVWVDGKTATVERANAVFIGTEVPAGKHRVEFRFLPTSALVGVTLTFLAALFLAYSWRRGSTDRAPEGMLAPQGNL